MKKPTFEIPKVITKRHDLTFKTNWAIPANKIVTDISSVKCAPCPRVSFCNGSGRLVTYSGSTVLIHSLELSPFIANAAEIKRMETQFENHTLITSHATNMPFAETRLKMNNPLNNSMLERLIVALYGDKFEQSDYGKAEERLNDVIDWLCARNKKYRVPAKGIAKIVYYLSVNDLKMAIDESLAQNQTRLATLLACATCPSSKFMLLQQLDSWKQSGADEHIEIEILKLYVILTGGVSWRTSKGKTIHPYKNLEWSQQLALLLLYATHDGLSNCISLLHTNTNDVEYHLLAEHSAWKTLDACLNEAEAWYLHQSLVSYNALQEDSKSDVVHGNFAAQLLAQSPKWALFVALHIKNDELREYAVGDIIGRGSLLMSKDDLKWIERSLLIPRSIVNIHPIGPFKREAELQRKKLEKEFNVIEFLKFQKRFGLSAMELAANCNQEAKLLEKVLEPYPLERVKISDLNEFF